MNRKKWGFYLYNGFPESGKTWKAVHRALERSRATGAPIMAIQREKDDENFKMLAHTQGLIEACTRFWEKGESVRVRARTPDEVEVLCAAALQLGPHESTAGGILIIDGIWDCLKYPNIKPSVDEIVRSGRHYRLDLHATSQMLGDFCKVARKNAMEVYQFREIDEDDLVSLRKRFGFDPEELKSLPPREYKFWGRWESWRKKPTPVKSAPIAKSPPKPGGPPPDPKKDAPGVDLPRRTDEGRPVAPPPPEAK